MNRSAAFCEERRHAFARKREGVREALSCFEQALERDPQYAVAHAAVAEVYVQYALFLMSWWLLARGVLRGVIDTGWLLGWILLLFSLVPFRLFATLTQGVLATTTGAAPSGGPGYGRWPRPKPERPASSCSRGTPPPRRPPRRRCRR